jgi:signal transduction histidine kinase
VRHIAHAHGGDVIVESTPGRGSKFVLILPLHSAAASASNSANHFNRGVGVA